MLSWLHSIQPLLQSYGYFGLALGVFLESMGFPVPGETLIISASVVAGTGNMNIYLVALSAVAASVLGDNLAYLIGRKGGRPLVLRYGSHLGITHDRLAYAEDLTNRRGFVIVMGARFFPVLRQINGLAAGTTRMRWMRFFAANVTGASLWVAMWATLAYRFGATPAIFNWLSNHLALLPALILPLLIILALYALLIRKKRKDSSGLQSKDGK